ncbi:GGDEF domain-containing protein [Paenibacillus sp. YYML68]|uniref:GGDEF domain-containing protein n=1 Tax=Paenibacillus sp. YYML68 TaxID=2909250 RepID=UPI002491D38F|nr:GGDEF domain-containing protein [Paenibacillus sp. YYML68]
MSRKAPNQVRYDAGRSHWNIRLCRVYRYVALIIIVANLLALPLIASVKPEVLEQFVYKNVLSQNVAVLLLLALSELVVRRLHKYQDYCILTLGALFPIVILYYTGTESSGLEFVMLMPVLVSIIYFEYRKVLFAFGSSLVLFTLLITLSEEHRVLLAVEQKMLGFGVVLGCSITAWSIVRRGLRMMELERNFLLKEEEHRLELALIDERARKDALTGLHNHRTFQEQLHETMEQAQGTGEQTSVHLALIDVDRFKSINDNFGHLTGDLVLRTIGKQLVKLQSEEVFAARYGGEEFALIFRSLDRSDVLACLEQLRAGVERTSIYELDGRHVTVSIGCTELRKDDDTSSLFVRTDEAMYKAKNNGRNRIIAELR